MIPVRCLYRTGSLGAGGATPHPNSGSIVEHRGSKVPRILSKRTSCQKQSRYVDRLAPNLAIDRPDEGRQLAGDSRGDDDRRLHCQRAESILWSLRHDSRAGIKDFALRLLFPQAFTTGAEM